MFRVVKSVQLVGVRTVYAQLTRADAQRQLALVLSDLELRLGEENVC